MSLIIYLLIGVGIAKQLGIPALMGVIAALYFYAKKYIKASTFQFNTNSQSIPATFHHHCFSLMGYIAKADGIISPQEIQVAEHIIREMGLNYTQSALAKRAFKQGSNGLNLANITNYLNLMKNLQPQLVQQFFTYQERIIHADSSRSANQIHILNQIKFHVYQNQHSRHQYQQQPAFSTGNLSKAYKTLGITPSMQFNEMKKSYRKLIGKHHPDRKQGAEAKKKANEMIKNLQSAWKVIETHHAKEKAV